MLHESFEFLDTDKNGMLSDKEIEEACKNDGLYGISEKDISLQIKKSGQDSDVFDSNWIKKASP